MDFISEGSGLSNLRPMDPEDATAIFGERPIDPSTDTEAAEAAKTLQDEINDDNDKVREKIAKRKQDLLLKQQQMDEFNAKLEADQESVNSDTVLKMVHDFNQQVSIKKNSAEDTSADRKKHKTDVASSAVTDIPYTEAATIAAGMHAKQKQLEVLFNAVFPNKKLEAEKVEDLFAKAAEKREQELHDAFTSHYRLPHRVDQAEKKLQEGLQELDAALDDIKHQPVTVKLPTGDSTQKVYNFYNCTVHLI